MTVITEATFEEGQFDDVEGRLSYDQITHI